MLGDVLKPVLVIVVAFGLKWVCGLLGLQLDDAVLNSIVAAIVSFLLAQFGVEEAARRGVRGFRKG